MNLTVLELIERDSSPSVVYVHGHVTLEQEAEAIEAAAAYIEEVAIHGGYDDWQCPRLGVDRRIWLRKVPLTEENYDGWDDEYEWCLAPCYEGDDGAMPLTEVIDLDQRDQEIARQLAIEAHAAEVRAAVLERWPDAEIASASGYPTGEGRATFRLPGLKGSIDWVFGKPHIWVLPGDVGAYNKLQDAYKLKEKP
jgi:hypothetical protein